MMSDHDRQEIERAIKEAESRSRFFLCDIKFEIRSNVAKYDDMVMEGLLSLVGKKVGNLLVTSVSVEDEFAGDGKSVFLELAPASPPENVFESIEQLPSYLFDSVEIKPVVREYGRL